MRFLITLFWVLALSIAPASAQFYQTPAQNQNQINAVPWTNGLGKVTGQTIYNILSAINQTFNLYQPLSGITSTVAHSNAALSALSSAAYVSVIRDGFAVAGDSPAVTFTPSATCPYNGGVADGGSCVSSSDGKFWVIVMPSQADVRDWGAKCDGSTIDTAGIQSALYDSRGVILPPNKVCIGSNLQVPTNTVFDLNGSVIEPAIGASYAILVGDMSNVGNGFDVSLINGYVVDPNDYTLRTATLSSTANPGATSISVSSKTGFVVGNAIKIPMGTSPVIDHTTKIMSISGTGPYTIGIKDPIPYSVLSATVGSSGGTACPATSQLAISGGAGPPAVLQVATASGNVAQTYSVLTPGLYDTSPGATNVATLSGQAGVICPGANANLTYATAAGGTIVSTAYGNVVIDQCTYCKVENLSLSTAPINLQLQNSGTSAPYYTTRVTIDNVNGDSSTITGFYKATGVSDSTFSNLNFTSDNTTGNGPAIYSENRDYGSAAPGGNTWLTINAAQAEICMLQRSPQLDQYPLLIDDNCRFYADIVTNGQQLRFVEHWENYVGTGGTGGVGMYAGENSLNVSLGNMYTETELFALFLDSTAVATTLNDDSWGPIRWLGGGGCYNCTTKILPGRPIVPQFLGVSAFTLYVATTGSDTNNECFLSSAPCATLLHAYSVASTLDQAGQWVVISLGAGTFQGIEASGANRGGVGTNISGPYIAIEGQGAGSTTIGDAAATGYDIEASDGVDLYVTGVTLSTSNGGYATFTQNGAVLQLGTVTISGANSSSVGIHNEGYGLTEVASGSTITATGSFSQLVSNGFTGGVLELDPGSGSIVCSSCAIANNVFFLDGAGANVEIGTGWTLSGFGSIAGRPYSVFGNSTITNFAGISFSGIGTGIGWRATGGLVDPEPTVATVSSTGIGSGGTATVVAATAAGGTIKLTAGTSASTTGTLTVIWPEYYLPNNNNTTVPAACSASVQDGAAGTWSGSFSVKVKSNTFGGLGLLWTNGSSLTNTQDYLITYTCGG